ncbi:MAG: S41 family peptidase [Coriobacteriia bacterium]
MTPLKRIALWTAVSATVLSLLFLAFAGGVLFERANPVARRTLVPGVDNGADDLDRIVNEVRGIIQRKALKPARDTSLTAGAISGMLDSLGDPYASYLNERHLTYFNEQSNGEFFGIGITVTVRDGQPFVVAPIPNTPAARAGLKAGDKIISIDGVTHKTWEVDDVVRRVRGPKDTTVKLLVERDGKRFKVSVKRAKIDVPNVESRMIGRDVGYVRLMGFNAKSGKEIASAMRALDLKGARGFVLDLRGNPGGLLSAAVDVTSLFVPEGVVVRVEARNKPEQVYRANGDPSMNKPLVVLVDNDSASASEIVAGALQDYTRATIVGVTTYGKGSVQSIEPLEEGGAVKLTIAHYLTPKRRVIDHKGVVPDVVVKMDPRDQSSAKTDTQLARAVKVLRAKF